LFFGSEKFAFFLPEILENLGIFGFLKCGLNKFSNFGGKVAKTLTSKNWGKKNTDISPCCVV
jgi:hypothetical protein